MFNAAAFARLFDLRAEHLEDLVALQSILSTAGPSFRMMSSY